MVLEARAMALENRIKLLEEAVAKAKPTEGLESPADEALISLSDPISAIVTGVLALVTKLVDLEILRESKMSPEAFNALVERNARIADFFTGWIPKRKTEPVPDTKEPVK